jgi:hypothetical protein
MSLAVGVFLFLFPFPALCGVAPPIVCVSPKRTNSFPSLDFVLNLPYAVIPPLCLVFPHPEVASPPI